MAPEQIWKWGTRLAQSTGKKFLVPLHFFGSTSTISHFGERFYDVQFCTVWSAFCLLYFYSWCPRAQPFVTVGRTCPPCPVESAPLGGAIRAYSKEFFGLHNIAPFSLLLTLLSPLPSLPLSLSDLRSRSP